MRTVYKYPFPLEQEFDIIMKRGAFPLKVEMQNGTPVIWALIESGEEDEVKHFKIYGTGHAIKESEIAYYGSVQVSGGMFVWHLFEVKPRPATPLNVA